MKKMLKSCFFRSKNTELQVSTDFLEKLPPHFIRIHKSFVINFKQLEMLDGNQVLLQNKTKIVVGKSYRKELLLRIDKGSQ